ncbi:MAG: hypothetical protein ABSF83_02965 [Nitrososphaerales archaeon]|jgi:hypothetical protein
MPKGKGARKSHTGTEEVLDSFESWLKRQKPIEVKAKAGFRSESAETS